MTGPAPPQRKEMREKGASANQSSSISHFSHPGVRREAYFALVGSSSKKLGSLYYPPLPLLPYTHTHTQQRVIFALFPHLSLQSFLFLASHFNTTNHNHLTWRKSLTLLFLFFSFSPFASMHGSVGYIVALIRHSSLFPFWFIELLQTDRLLRYVTLFISDLMNPSPRRHRRRRPYQFITNTTTTSRIQKSIFLQRCWMAKEKKKE